MITRVVQLEIKEQHVEEFKLLFAENCLKIKASQGCLSLKLLNNLTEKNVFYTLSTWDSENDLNNYRKSELFGQIWPRTKTLLHKKPWAQSLVTIKDV